jgi:aminomethyltransferase
MTQAPDTTEAIETQGASETAPVHAPDSAATGEAAPPAAPAALLKTPLHSLHVARGGRMVPFAGYEMPVQYADGIIAEHNHVRSATGLFDVSHMGQAFLVGADHETVARALEALVPADIVNLAPGRQRYTQFTDESGGILDDLMVTRSADPAEDGVLFLVVNAATKEADYAHLSAHLPAGVRLIRADHRALIAVQGPMARQAVGRHCPEAVPMMFMSAITTRFDGIDCHISRSGYTGEDGFEISCKATRVRAIAERLLSEPSVKPIGLGARDSLRLEAGLCLYGHDIDTTTSPVEAALTWSIQKRRRTEGGFPGAERIQREITENPARMRVGIKPEGRAPAREGTEIRSIAGEPIGKVTSGGFGPSVNGPVSMGYVESGFGEVGTGVQLIVRGKPLAASVVALPFVPHKYVR